MLLSKASSPLLQWVPFPLHQFRDISPNNWPPSPHLHLQLLYSYLLAKKNKRKRNLPLTSILLLATTPFLSCTPHIGKFLESIVSTLCLHFLPSHFYLIYTRFSRPLQSILSTCISDHHQRQLFFETSKAYTSVILIFTSFFKALYLGLKR